MNLDEKLLEICRLFRIEGDFLGHNTIQMGNVNKTYEVKFRLPDGKKKSFLVQNVNTYVFKNPVQVMENIDKVTEHIRAKLPGQLTLHFHHTADRKTYVEDGSNFWRMTKICSTRQSLISTLPSAAMRSCWKQPRRTRRAKGPRRTTEKKNNATTRRGKGSAAGKITRKVPKFHRKSRRFPVKTGDKVQ